MFRLTYLDEFRSLLSNFEHIYLKLVFGHFRFETPSSHQVFLTANDLNENFSSLSIIEMKHKENPVYA